MTDLQGLTRRLFVATGLTGCSRILAQRPHAGQDELVFDTQSLEQILRWAQSESTEIPAGWRDQMPYRLAREQAQWNGRPDPCDEVLRQLTRIAQRAQDASIHELVDRTARLLAAVMKGRNDFIRSAVPHRRVYLPPRTPIQGVVALAAFLPSYAFSMNGTIVLSLTDRFWAGNAALVFNLLVHELFHNGFVQHQRGTSPNEAADGRALLEALLWQVQNEGMATYVAYQAKPAGLAFGDYEKLDRPAEAARLFGQCRDLMADIRAAAPESLPSLRERLWRECNMDWLSYIVGAAMARRIEQIAGRPALVRTIEEGPAAFLAAYRATSPPWDLEL